MSGVLAEPRFGEALPRLTLEQYYRLIKAGSIVEGGPFELLDGRLIAKNRAAEGKDSISVGSVHVYAVEALGELKSRASEGGMVLRLQQPIDLPPINAPEPDAVFAVGNRRKYAERHPIAADVLLVIEVADSSLKEDLEDKLRLYAAFGIPRYMVVDVRRREVHGFGEPIVAETRYAEHRILTEDARYAFSGPGGDPFELELSELFA